MWLGCCLVIQITGCAPNSEKVKGGLSYFDNATWFGNEIKKIKQANPGVMKTTAINGKNDRKLLHIKNWDDELRLFSSINLNKSAFSGKYLVDSAYVYIDKKEIPEQRFLRLTYRAKSITMPIQYYQVDQRDDKVLRIKARKKEKSAFFESGLELQFVPDSGYSLRGIQSIRGMNRNDYYVGVSFEKP